MKLFSFNVNGIRAALQKGLLDFLRQADADVYCFQEFRSTPEQVALELSGYELLINPAEKKGYSGTALLSRLPLAEVRFGIGTAEHDREGRVITAELGGFHLVNCYTPNSQRGLARLEYRLRWDQDFLTFLRKLEQRKPVVLCGDLNVAHQEIDLENPRSNRRNAGFTDEERAGFDRLLAAGFVDTFREFEKGGGHYTWWSNFARSRERNIGWRVDYFCISKALRPRLRAAAIHPEVLGSDHCPVSCELA